MTGSKMLWSIKITVVVRLTFNGFLFLSVTQRLGIRVTDVTNSIPWTAVFPPKYVISYRSRRVRRLHQVPCVLIFFRHMAKKRSRSVQEKNRNTSSAPDGREKSKSIQGSRRNSRLSPQSQTTTRSTHSVKRDLKSTRVPSKGSTGNNHDCAKESTKRKHF